MLILEAYVLISFMLYYTTQDTLLESRGNS